MDYGTKYMTLSNNKEIGENLVEDLKTYFILLFKNKYKYNYRILNKITITDPITDKIYKKPDFTADNLVTSSNYMYYDLGEEKDNNPEIKEIENYIKKNMKEEDDEKKDGELSNKSSIEIPEKIYNQDISLKKNYRDKSIELGYIPIISVVDTVYNTTSNYYSPLLEYNYTNYDFQEKAQIYDDLNKLNIIFKNANYKNIDDMVLLDFYKEFTSKIKKLKDDIISTDPDLKEEIINNIYDKLLIIYDVKTNGIKKFNKTTTKLDTNNCKDSHLHGKKEPFDIIRCEILKRAEILKKLGKEQKGGAPSVENKEKLNTTLTTIFEATEKTKEDMYENYLEIDKNILSAIINSDELKKKIIDKKVTDNIKSFKKFTKDVFKITPKKLKKNNIAESITFSKFTEFIKKIKDKLTEDSIRYLTIIKYLNIIKNTNNGSSAILGGAPPQNQDKQKPINQNQEINSQEQNPGKTYIKNFTDIYISLVKEYYKFIKNPEGAKQLIKDITAEDKETTDVDKEEEMKQTERIREDGEEAEKKKAENKKRIDEWEKNNKDLYNDNNQDNRTVASQREAEAAAKLKQKEKYGQENKDISNEQSRITEQKKNLTERKKELEDSLKTIKVVLRKLYNECINIQAPYATEYSEYTKSIIKIGKLKLLIDDNVEINNNNDIVSAYNDQIAIITKEIGAKDEQNKSLDEKKKINEGLMRGGDTYAEAKEKETEKIDEELKNKYVTLKKEKERLTEVLKDNLYMLIQKTGEDSGLNNLYDFIKYLKESFGGDDDDNNMDTVSSKKYNDKDTLFEKIWSEYNDGIKAYNINSKNKDYLTYMNEGEKLKNKIILNDLDPEIVLKVNFQDKVVFVTLMFAIRTIVMVIFEFLIEYNVIKSLRYSILIYAGLYILLLLLFTAFVNLDSYKLRIVFNYLNMHINTSNIILHIMLFTIFSFLVIVIIQTDNFINNVGDILDFTYIYNYIYTFNFDNLLSGEFENNLSKDEKIKLQYRLDIISNLIFIFTATLILLI